MEITLRRFFGLYERIKRLAANYTVAWAAICCSLWIAGCKKKSPGGLDSVIRTEIKSKDFKLKERPDEIVPIAPLLELPDASEMRSIQLNGDLSSGLPTLSPEEFRRLWKSAKIAPNPSTTQNIWAYSLWYSARFDASNQHYGVWLYLGGVGKIVSSSGKGAYLRFTLPSKESRESRSIGPTK